jgi:hypothetical protein
MDEWRHLRLGRAPEVELAAETDIFALEILELVGDSGCGRKCLDLLGSKPKDRLELCDILLELFDICLALCSMSCLGASIPGAHRAVLWQLSGIGNG